MFGFSDIWMNLKRIHDIIKVALFGGYVSGNLKKMAGIKAAEVRQKWYGCRTWGLAPLPTISSKIGRHQEEGLPDYSCNDFLNVTSKQAEGLLLSRLTKK